MGLSVVTYALCKKYTDDTAASFGGLKGAPCKVKSVNKADGQSVITLEWKNDAGATQESYVYVNDGVTQWVPDRPYAIGDLVIYDDTLYSCITPNNDHTFNPSKWTSISGGSAETDYYIVDLQSSIPVSFASTERKIYYCLEDSNFHLWDGAAWSIISSDIKKRELTQAQYDALTPAEKMNGTLYFITDAETYTNIIEGYFNSADNLFYEENTYVTPIAGEHNTIYISIDINKSFRYDNLTEIFVRLDEEGGGGSSTLAGLDDTDISASVHEGQILRMNNSGDWENVDMPSIPANTSDLVNDSNFVSDSSYVHTDNNYDATAKGIVDNITTNLNDKVDKVSGKGLSTNDYTDIDKNIVSNISVALTNKVDKVIGKDLSTNDYDNLSKNKLDNLVDIKSIGSGLNFNTSTGELTATGASITIDNAIDLTSVNPVQNMVIATALDGKVNTEVGKGLSTNDYTDIDKNIVSNISTVLSGKVDKVPGKGLSTEDYTTADKTKLGTLENYDDTALSGRVSDIEDIIPSGASSSDQLAKVSDIPDVSNFITNTVNNLTNYYTKSETYTKAEVNSAIGAISTISFDIESTLPTENIQTNVIYLIPKSTATTNNIYDEYINLNGTSTGWELIGTTEIDLSGYVTTSDLNTALNNYVTSSDLTTILADYVTDIELGTALSDYVETSDLNTTLADYTPTSDLETTLGTSLIPNGGTTGQALVKSSNNNRDVTWSTISAGGGNPVGTIISFFGTTAPDGYLSCDGSIYNIADYPALANHMSQFVGYVGTTQFKVPDLRGEFLRGAGTNSHENQGNGSSVGTHQNSTEINPIYSDDNGTYYYEDNDQIHTTTNQIRYLDKQITNTKKAMSVSAEMKKQAYTGSSTYWSFGIRPTNTSVLYCIKY